MRERDGYVIGRFATSEGKSSALFYAEGFCVYPQWTYRESANRYSSKREAIKEAKALKAEGLTVFVEPYHNPFYNVRPVWVG